MTRDAFLAALKINLAGLSPTAADEILADYASHFDEGLAAGRKEEDIAAALGDPARLARELRAQAGLRRWDEERSPSAAAGAVLAILSLGAIDLLVLLPILLVVSSLIFTFACVGVALTVCGVFMLMIAPFAAFAGHFVQALLGGMGCLGAGVAICALMSVATIALVNVLIRYGRFHVRLLKPITA